MGRSPVPTYQVKNTFVEFAPVEAHAESPHSMWTTSEVAVNGQNVPQEDLLTAKTPSPFLHPAQAPDGMLMQMSLAPGYNQHPYGTAFGDVPADFDLNSYEGGMVEYPNCCQVYDPVSGMCVVYDWHAQYQNCHMMELPPLSALSGESMGPEGQSDPHFVNGERVVQDGTVPLYRGGVYGEHGHPSPEATGGPCDTLPCQEAMIDYTDGQYGYIDNSGGGHQQPGTEGRSRRNKRDRGDRGDRGNRVERADTKAECGDRDTQIEIGHGESEVQQFQGEVDFTTVMFRNIPNKYSREMLVNQLEQNLKGQFDFVYLPIDFKNKCNVGYAFINFRSVEACQSFLTNFNGVEVRKCLPGLNSRKVTEVTPARVQGFEDNVQRLRNSPVMRELVLHPDWMPLIFDENGEQQLFPAPERPLDPIKPRRRGRDEHGSYGNA